LSYVERIASGWRPRNDSVVVIANEVKQSRSLSYVEGIASGWCPRNDSVVVNANEVKQSRSLSYVEGIASGWRPRNDSVVVIANEVKQPRSLSLLRLTTIIFEKNEGSVILTESKQLFTRKNLRRKKKKGLT
jgi:hypothetical protein